jgi:hypothetical protein
MNELLNFVLMRVSLEMNNQLYKPFESDEVKDTLFQMVPLHGGFECRWFHCWFFPAALGSAATHTSASYLEVFKWR